MIGTNPAVAFHPKWVDELFPAPKEAEVPKELKFGDFLRQTLPPGWTSEARHIKEITERLEKVASGEIKRLAIHMPPRHGKSETVTYRFPVYWLERFAERNVLVTGYNQDFVRKFGRKTRALGLKRDITNAKCKYAADEWEAKDGGLAMFRGVGSPPTGTGFNLIVMDDPIKSRQDAESPVMRERMWDWYTDDLRTRLEPDGAMVLIMTLWHEDDVGARIVAAEPDKWEVLKLPALAVEDDILGREPGEALWPERFDVEALEEIHSIMAQNEGERAWLALYQCDPRAREGHFFKPDMIQVLDRMPEINKQVMRWDLAASTGGDYTAGVHMARTVDGNWVILDIVRGRWLPDERNRIILKTVSQKGLSVLHCFSQDPGQAGVDQRRDISIKLQGHNFKWVRETGSKTTRADPFASQVNVGNISMMRADWNAPFLAELRSFIPDIDNVRDDQVDAASGAHALLVQPIKREGAGFKRKGGYV